MLWLSTAAQADPHRALARWGEVPKKVQVGSLVGEPLRTRGKGGAWSAWRFADGVVEHAIRLDGKRLAERVLTDGRGHREITVTYGPDARPLTVVGPAETLDVAAWTSAPLPGGTIQVATAPQAVPHGQFVTEPQGQLGWRDTAPVDPADHAVTDELAGTCGCDLVERRSLFIDGRPAVLWTADWAEPGGPVHGALAAVTHADRTLWFSWKGAGDDPAMALSERLALVTWEPAP